MWYAISNFSVAGYVKSAFRCSFKVIFMRKTKCVTVIKALKVNSLAKGHANCFLIITYLK